MIFCSSCNCINKVILLIVLDYTEIILISLKHILHFFFFFTSLGFLVVKYDNGLLNDIILFIAGLWNSCLPFTHANMTINKSVIIWFIYNTCFTVELCYLCEIKSTINQLEIVRIYFMCAKCVKNSPYCVYKLKVTMDPYKNIEMVRETMIKVVWSCQKFRLFRV